MFFFKQKDTADREKLMLESQGLRPQ